MKLLVTGGLGFIGSNFIVKLLKNFQDIHITNVDAELMGSNQKNLSEINQSPNYNFVKGNITNNALLWGSRGNGKSTLIKSIFNDEEFVELNMTIGWWGGMTSIVVCGLDLD